MIPIRDENPTRSVSFVTVGLIVVNVLVFVHELRLQGPEQVEAFFASFALIPTELIHAHAGRTYATVFTSMFLHAGWAHLLGNMWFLWIFGNNIEDSVGHFKFLFFYLVCGVAAAAAQVAISPDSMVPMVGGSGAISGVLGAYLLLFPRVRVLTLVPIWIILRFIYLPAWLLLLVWFGMQLLSGLAVVGVNLTGGVAFWAHIGGFAAGILLIVPFKKRRVRLFQ